MRAVSKLKRALFFSLLVLLLLIAAGVLVAGLWHIVSRVRRDGLESLSNYALLLLFFLLLPVLNRLYTRLERHGDNIEVSPPSKVSAVGVMVLQLIYAAICFVGGLAVLAASVLFALYGPIPLLSNQKSDYLSLSLIIVMSVIVAALGVIMLLNTLPAIKRLRHTCTLWATRKWA
jgi:hypothetical protein